MSTDPSTVDPATEVAAAVAPEDRASDAPAGIGTEYGSPYDSSTPPYSVYRDPKRAAIEAEEAATAENAKKGSGSELVFDGHEDPHNGTQRLVTPYGSVSVGETIRLSKEHREELEAKGFRFSKP